MQVWRQIKPVAYDNAIIGQSVSQYAHRSVLEHYHFANEACFGHRNRRRAPLTKRILQGVINVNYVICIGQSRILDDTSPDLNQVTGCMLVVGECESVSVLDASDRVVSPRGGPWSAVSACSF